MNSSFENYNNLNPKQKRLIFYVLVGVMIFAIGAVGLGFTDNELIIEDGQLEITGQYGEAIPLADIQLIELTEKRPSLRRRINGFSFGSRKKGFFRTTGGEKVKAIINSNARPWILITKKSGDKIYFSSNGKSNQSIYQELKKTLPNKG
ncbi:hypothetical protein FEE95_13775 [Maribacter algarum]|uniref:Bacterial Pleckstrin homology domain-containing protein n=1 Tax=Maribacter algarum (ex Zhang et al. 2020) TaxID=2578118 RepID=A0A5S3PUD7_9FLAO|nr:hypothetical protein [Maribacter algarum]TMM57543.1 hypothetical protein FEE95_13775 [Maribacter algarum]